MEILLVVFIISLVYSLTLSNFKFSNTLKSTKVSLENLPLYLSKYNDKFLDNLQLICLNDGKKCILKLDGQTVEEVSDLFNEKPTVFQYNKDLQIINYDDIEIRHLDRYEVCFKYEINKYKKSKDMIVESNNKIYIFNSMYKKAIVLESTVDVYDYFDELNNEVRDAF